MPDAPDTALPGRLRAVADAGPLIHLQEIGRPEPWRLFGSVLVPEEVARELRRAPDAPGVGLLDASAVEVVVADGRAKEDAAVLSLRHEVSVADGAVLALARSRGIQLVLTDDLELRDAAKTEGVRPVGSLGLVLRSATAGFLDEQVALDSLDALMETSSLFVTPSLVSLAKAALRDRRA